MQFSLAAAHVERWPESSQGSPAAVPPDSHLGSTVQDDSLMQTKPRVMRNHLQITPDPNDDTASEEGRTSPAPTGEPPQQAWCYPDFLSPHFASDTLASLHSLSRQEVQQNSDVSDLTKNHFHRRGTALRGKSSVRIPALWGRSGMEPPFTGMTKIFLAISQSCPTISRRATRYQLPVSLQGYCFCSQTLQGKREARSAPFYVFWDSHLRMVWGSSHVPNHREWDPA